MKKKKKNKKKREIKKVIEDLIKITGDDTPKDEDIIFLYKTIGNILKNINKIEVEDEHVLLEIVKKSNKECYLILSDFLKKKENINKILKKI